MDDLHLSSADGPYQTPQSATSSTNTSSPSLSLFTRGHSSRGSGSTSSLGSSPITRDSLDLFGGAKRLEDVTEDPSEREDGHELIAENRRSRFDDYNSSPLRTSFDQSPPSFPSDTPWSLGDQDAWSTSSSTRRHFKRQRSVDYPSSSVTNRLVNRFPSLSKRWKTKSAAGPQLSVVTHLDASPCRTHSGTSSQLISPALSAISKHESYLPPSPVRTTYEGSFGELNPIPIGIEKKPAEEEEPVQATTPLLPPVFSQLAVDDSPIHSPLQSPTIAATAISFSSSTPTGTPVMATLPSPPLSSKPSLASVGRRSRSNTANLSTSEIPHLQMLDDRDDPWAQRLGHANFSIHPEPYTPSTIDLDSYRELRLNWDLARCNYAKHLARTGEHYGTTSKVYLLTQEKWNSIDYSWKRQHDHMTVVLNPVLARISDGDTTISNSMDSSAVLEKPVTRVIVPKLGDPSGKFPELGDEDIVGPMSVVPARDFTMQKSGVDSGLQNHHTRKRSLFKFLSEVLGRGPGHRN